MVAVAQGTSATVSAQFSVTGTPTDPTTLTITISGGAGIGPTTAGIVHPATGRYFYTWSVPSGQAVGDYPVTWTSDLGSLADVISVIATSIAIGSTWATVADVQSMTRITVDDATLLAAQAVIDLYSETPIESFNSIRPRDRLRLKQALVFQAAWMTSAPDLFTRDEVSSAGHAATSFAYTEPQSVTLAPLAKRALALLSWKRSRSVRIRAARPNAWSLRQQWFDMEHDTGPYADSSLWSPM